MKSILQRTRTIGPVRIYPVPIQLDALVYRGAMVQGTNGQMFYSNGSVWLEIATVDDITPGVVIVPDIAARDEIDPVAGLQAFVEDRGNGQWALYIYDGDQWIEVSNQRSSESEAKTLTVDLRFDDPSQILAGAVANNSRITIITVTVSQAFATDSVLNIGDEDINNRLFPNEFLDLSLPDIYFVQSNFVYTSTDVPGDTDLFLYFDAGSATQGQARIVITYV